MLLLCIVLSSDKYKYIYTCVCVFYFLFSVCTRWESSLVIEIFLREIYDIYPVKMKSRTKIRSICPRVNLRVQWKIVSNVKMIFARLTNRLEKLRSIDILFQKYPVDNLWQWQTNQTHRPLFILHDGPPFANGPLHIGHFLNKVRKLSSFEFRSFLLRFKRILSFGINYWMDIELIFVLVGIVMVCRLNWKHCKTSIRMIRIHWLFVNLVEEIFYSLYEWKL